MVDFAEPDDNNRAILEGDVQRVVDSVCRQTLDRMPGEFSRLIYLASLRDHNTGRYNHYGLECRYPSEAVNEGLRRCHLQVFNDLVSQPLQKQTQDLIHFFDSLRAERPRLVDVWRRLRAFEVLPPEECHPLARELFRKNVEIVLRMLKQTELWDLLDDTHGDADNLT